MNFDETCQKNFLFIKAIKFYALNENFFLEGIVFCFCIVNWISVYDGSKWSNEQLDGMFYLLSAGYQPL